jgi:hypothetical protein
VKFWIRFTWLRTGSSGRFDITRESVSGLVGESVG